MQTNSRLRPGNRLLIVGASARQIAESADRAGYRCTTLDLFGDWDTRNVAQAHQVRWDSICVDKFLNDLPQLPDAMILGGGMEKRTALVERFQQQIPLLGTGWRSMDRTGDPFDLAATCRSRHIRFPQVCRWVPHFPPPTGKWLKKPRHSAGGSAISVWGESVGVSQSGRAVSWFGQEYIEGKSFSTVFAVDFRHCPKKVGTSRQIVGTPPFTKRPFTYCGSIGPITLDSRVERELSRMARELSQEYQLKGVVGIDWVLDDRQQPWLIEVNPRISASAEIFEDSTGQLSIAQLHIDACTGQQSRQPFGHNALSGKAVVYADWERDVVIDATIGEELVRRYRSQSPAPLADIPCVGTTISPGEPVLTVFAHPPLGSESRALQQLAQAASEICETIKKLAAEQAASDGG